MASFKYTTSLLCISLLVTAMAQGVHHSDDSDFQEECKNRPCEAGYFCYKETFICAPCIDCATRFRHNNSFACHQKSSDCGDCLPGYVEPNLEHDVPKESCSPQTPGVITTSKTAFPQSEPEYVINYVAFLSGVSVLSLFLVASFLYRWHKERRVSPPQEATELQELMVTQQPPPPYSPFAFKSPADADINPVPTAPVLDSTVQIESPRNCDTNIYVEAHRLPPARERVHLVQAAVCNPPNWVNTRDYRPDTPQSTTPPSSNDSADGAYGESIHDENTQESHWTPNTSQENVEESQNQGANHVEVGSTAVGTVDVPDVGNHRGSRIARRASSEDLASSQESQDDAPRQKRMRSESPPRQPTRNFVFSQNNSSNNNNNMAVNHMSAIHINVNLNRSDDRHEGDQNSNALVHSDQGSQC